ncbi:hypothetical protein [Fibrella aestuarina]|uniref:hypothetical protein n=1 Tax=Fibrella aestuarina TaxID=651143 RepID=UPI00059E623E|nr:hypothetical protein [Fibrella aestuarina]
MTPGQKYGGKASYAKKQGKRSKRSPKRPNQSVLYSVSQAPKAEADTTAAINQTGQVPFEAGLENTAKNQETYNYPPPAEGNVAFCYRLDSMSPIMEGPASVFQVLDESMSPRYPKGCYLFCSPVFEYSRLRAGTAFLFMITENRFREVVAVDDKALTLRVRQPAEAESERIFKVDVQAIYAVEWVSTAEPNE